MKQKLDFLHFELAILLHLTSMELGEKNRCGDGQYLEKGARVKLNSTCLFLVWENVEKKRLN